MGFVELLGYVASALVVLSLAMSSVVRLRVVSAIGAITMTAYGWLLGSMPVVVTNVAVTLVNVWYLSRELGGARDLRVIVVPGTDPYLRDLVQVYRRDIEKNWGTAAAEIRRDDFAAIVTRDGVPRGLVVGSADGDVLNLRFDYVVPEHRDSGIGAWLYTRGAATFRKAGFRRVESPHTSRKDRYLSSVGFTRSGDRLVRAL